MEWLTSFFVDQKVSEPDPLQIKLDYICDNVKQIDTDLVVKITENNPCRCDYQTFINSHDNKSLETIIIRFLSSNGYYSYLELRSKERGWFHCTRQMVYTSIDRFDETNEFRFYQIHDELDRLDTCFLNRSNSPLLVNTPDCVATRAAIKEFKVKHLELEKICSGLKINLKDFSKQFPLFINSSTSQGYVEYTLSRRLPNIEATNYVLNWESLREQIQAFYSGTISLHSYELIDMKLKVELSIHNSDHTLHSVFIDVRVHFNYKSILSN